MEWFKLKYGTDKGIDLKQTIKTTSHFYKKTTLAHKILLRKMHLQHVLDFMHDSI